MITRDIFTITINSGPLIEQDKEKYIIYHIYIKNNRTGHKSIVKRRYSEFYKLRKELIAFVNWGHCAYCMKYADLISTYPFPRRHLFRSNQSAVIQERVDHFEMFTRYILHCSTSGTFDGCPQAERNIRQCILTSFLGIDNIDAILAEPSTTAAASTTTSAPSRSTANTTATIDPTSVDTPQSSLEIDENSPARRIPSRAGVDVDTCHICLQNWNDCYCSDEASFPVGGEGVFRMPPPRSARSTASSGAPDSVLTGADDASTCSQCNHDWDGCFCGQGPPVIRPLPSNY